MNEDLFADEPQAEDLFSDEQETPNPAVETLKQVGMVYPAVRAPVTVVISLTPASTAG